MKIPDRYFHKRHREAEETDKPDSLRNLICVPHYAGLRFLPAEQCCSASWSLMIAARALIAVKYGTVSPRGPAMPDDSELSQRR